ncbi:MAG TPA: regulatory iron-sulfur-containing complex subunit RicT [Micromonosporaceae bacterium]|jgi:cell fate regulator YaaT (PSP1 superfamily)
MGQLCAVNFNRHGRLFYLNPGEHRPRVGDQVLVPTDEGPELATCVWAPEWVDIDTEGFPTLIGLAGPDDVRRDEQIRRAKAEAGVAARRLIRAHELPMKVVAVDHVPGAVGATRPGASGAGASGAKTTIYFTAPHRVDFRALVRDLGATLHCRVELRQLSARDSARVQGGIGSCGRDLCCATFLTDFEPVTIRMAKDQDLPLNPMRIAGACGRLMCCLKYEHPLYDSAPGTYPASGAQVETPEGPGRVISKFPPAQSVAIRLQADGRAVRCPVSDVCGSRRAYESR